MLMMAIISRPSHLSQLSNSHPRFSEQSLTLNGRRLIINCLAGVGNGVHKHELIVDWERPSLRKRTEIKDAVHVIGTHSGRLNGQTRRQGGASGATPHETFLSIAFIYIHLAPQTFSVHPECGELLIPQTSARYQKRKRQKSIDLNLCDPHPHPSVTVCVLEGLV
jgi:hypothetical protein